MPTLGLSLLLCRIIGQEIDELRPIMLTPGSKRGESYLGAIRRHRHPGRDLASSTLAPDAIAMANHMEAPMPFYLHLYSVGASSDKASASESMSSRATPLGLTSL